MADKEFDIQEIIAKRGILLNISPHLEPRQQQMPALDIERTRINTRIHVEWVIEWGYQFEILNQKFPHTMHDLVSDINCVFVHMFLMNFNNSLIE